jgi:hypothetical protein
MIVSMLNFNPLLHSNYSLHCLNAVLIQNDVDNNGFTNQNLIWLTN